MNREPDRYKSFLADNAPYRVLSERKANFLVYNNNRTTITLPPNARASVELDRDHLSLPVERMQVAVCWGTPDSHKETSHPFTARYQGMRPAVSLFGAERITYLTAWFRDVWLTMAAHELDEWLRVDGNLIHDPH